MKTIKNLNHPGLPYALLGTIVIGLVFIYSPCLAEQIDNSLDAPDEKISTQNYTIENKKISVIKQRETEEKEKRAGFFSLTPHRQNYILPLTYNFYPNKDAYEFANLDEPKELEVKFQLSFKVLLLEKIFRDTGDLYFGYTQLSFWQLYDEALSSPFRDTNYEPEIFLKIDTDFDLLGLNVQLFTLGFNHESNGRGGDISRSWNRIYAVMLMARGNFVLGLKPWYRLPEKEADDDNPKTEKYMGYGEIFCVYRLNRNVFSGLFRNNLRSEKNFGAMELGWSYRVTNNVRIYAQYFFGYGESLLDYNHKSNRIGIGVMLNDWL